MVYMLPHSKYVPTSFKFLVDVAPYTSLHTIKQNFDHEINHLHFTLRTGEDPILVYSCVLNVNED
jgi:hypothetical protein